jgi:hypothetical protein
LAPLERAPLQLPHRSKAAIGGRTLDMRSGELGLVPLMKQKASKKLYPLIVALPCSFEIKAVFSENKFKFCKYRCARRGAIFRMDAEIFYERQLKRIYG